MEQAKDEVTELLRRRRHVKPSEPDNFGISSAESLIAQFRQVISTVALVMVVISSIGLLVGGIGVMNIMLVSVTERTREIGVRKAIGARRSDITWQFLLEAMTLTAAGGLIGILVGWLLSWRSGRSCRVCLPRCRCGRWSPGFGMATSVGLFFGHLAGGEGVAAGSDRGAAARVVTATFTLILFDSTRFNTNSS